MVATAATMGVWQSEFVFTPDVEKAGNGRELELEA